jgi:hypothetical protein
VLLERRQERRFPASATVVASLPTHGEREVGRTGTLRGTVVNLSESGACVLVDRFVEPLTVLPFKFQFSDAPVSVPVLAQVRWAASASSNETAHWLGLLFFY